MATPKSFSNKKIILVGSILLLVISAGCITIFKQPPNELNLPVPFSTQAPTGNWANNEACEETSAIMAEAYLNGNTQETLEADVVQDGITTLIAWENDHLKYNENTGARDTATMIENTLNLKTTIKEDFTEGDLKTALSNNAVLLLPLNAQSLDPSNYPDLHPTYHMVVIRGYKDHTFFVNDPGTSKGKNNAYTFEEIHNFAADWNQETQKIDTNKKVVIVVFKF